jgi:hypothetical protein
MYSKTRLGSDQIDGSLSLSPRGRRIAYLVLAVVLAAGLGIGLWSAFSSDTYATSANGCVNVTVPSSTGGGTLHYCGDAAKAFCRGAFANSDQISLLARPQCDAAGLPAAKVDAG